MILSKLLKQYILADIKIIKPAINKVNLSHKINSKVLPNHIIKLPKTIAPRTLAGVIENLFTQYLNYCYF